MHKLMYNVGYDIIYQHYPRQVFGIEQICVPKFPAKYANTDFPIKRYTVTMSDLFEVHSLHYVS